MDSKKEIENVVRQAEIEARNNLKGWVKENQIGYIGCLRREMKSILSKKGIDWKPDDGECSID